MKKNHKKGFTLVELVIVIAVIAILATVLVPTFAGILERARESARLQQITSAKNEIFSDNKQFETISDLEGYMFVMEDNVYQVKNDEIKNVTNEVSVEEIENTYIQSIIQSTNSNITIYESKSEEIKTYIDFSLDEIQKTATIIGYNGTVQGELIIPEYIQGTYGTEIIKTEFFNFDDFNMYCYENIEEYFYTNPDSDKIFMVYYDDYNKVKSYNKDNYDLIGKDFDEFFEYSNFIIEVEVTTYCIGEKEYKVTSIDDYAFQNCTGLTSVTIPNSIIDIGKYAFSYCSGLSEIIVPNSVTEIKDEVFHGCTGLTKIQISNNATSIGYCAFYFCTGLTEIIIPNSVTIIDDSAFSNCTSLESISIPSSVKSIGNSSFSYCTSLVSVIMSEGLTSIGYSAFSNCTALSGKIIMPTSLKKIEHNVFKNTLVEFNTYDNCNYLPSVDNDYFILYQMMDTTLSSVTMHNNTVLVAGYAFYQSNIVRMTITNNVISLGYGAFYYCESLTTVTMSNNLIYFSTHAFGYCKTLGNVYYNGIIEDWCKIIFDNYFSNPMYYAINLYMLDENNNYYAVTQVTIPNSITNINENTFYFCKNIKSVEIPNTVTSIGKNAFYGCSGLTTITIPDSVNYIGEYAFYKCTGLNQVLISNGVTNIDSYAFYGCSGLTKITIPNSVTKIGDQVLFGCTSLTQATIASSVTSIGNYAFYKCTSLINVYYNGTIGDWCKILFSDNYSNPMYYASNLYMLDETDTYYKVTQISIPDSVTSLRDYAFYYLKNLTSIEISDSVTSIGKNVFCGCTGLTSINLPNKLESLGGYAFYGCVNLSSITMPHSLTSIGSHAFYGCTSLNSIIIPDSVTNIGEYAFRDCVNLITISLSNNLKIVSNYIFYGCTSLNSITIPESVITVGVYSFYNCKNITSLIIPSNVTRISQSAFRNCTGLKSVIISNSITFIDYSVFYGCTNLTEVTFLHTTENEITINSNCFFVDSITQLTIYVVDINNIALAIQNYDWSGSNREVTYEQIAE